VAAAGGRLMPAETPKTVAGVRSPIPMPASTPAARVFTDDDDHGLVQRRLGLLYGILGGIVLGFWAISVVIVAIMLPQRFWELHTSASKLVHLGTGIVLVLVYVVCRGKLRSRWVLSSLDLAGMFEISLSIALVVGLSPKGLRAEGVAPAAFLLAASLRAALVPSPPRWTVLVVALGAIPVPMGSYFLILHDETWNTALAPRESLAVIISAWCVAGVISSYAISKVVYGLRAEVKSATRLGQYTLEDKIGEGGMGVVYRARHALLRRPTAIKLLSPGHVGSVSEKRFEKEVQTTAMLTHPNTIAIYDFGHTRDGVFYYAMELLDGVSLQDLVDDEGPQPPGRVVRIVTQIASALAEAHGVGLIHRDVKPANVFLCERAGVADFVKVLDFGLVKEVGKSDPALSRADAIAGTPLYMAPESITHPDAVDARVDIYALGGVAYFLVTGKPPFDGNNLVEICSHHLHTAPVRPSERLKAAVPERLEAVLLKCLAKFPDERFPTARALVKELRDLAAHDPACAWIADDDPAANRAAQ
jgi:serine/threonine-protein kinase